MLCRGVGLLGGGLWKMGELNENERDASSSDFVASDRADFFVSLLPFFLSFWDIVEVKLECSAKSSSSLLVS